MEQSRVELHPAVSGQQEQACAQEFKGKGQDNNTEQETTQTKTGILEQVLAHGNAVSQGHLLPEKIHGQGGQGHNSQTAGLDQKEDDQLAGMGKGGTGVHHRKSGNAGCRGGSEQGICPGQGVVGGQADRQTEEQAACQDGQAEEDNREKKRLKDKSTVLAC